MIICIIFYGVSYLVNVFHFYWEFLLNCRAKYHSYIFTYRKINEGQQMDRRVQSIANSKTHSVCLEIEKQLIGSYLYLPTSTIINCLFLVLSGAICLMSVSLSTFVIWAITTTNTFNETPTANAMLIVAIYSVIKDCLSMTVGTVVNILVAVTNVYVISNHEELVTLLKYLEIISCGTNLGYVWLISTHTFLHFFLLKLYMDKFVVKYVIQTKVLLIFAVFFFCFCIFLQSMIRFPTNPAVCNSTRHNITYPLYTVPKRAYEKSLIIRCVLITIPVLFKLLVSGALIYKLSYFDAMNKEFDSAFISKVHAIPGCITFLIQYSYFCLELVYIHGKASGNQKIPYGFNDINQQSVQMLQSLAVMASYVLCEPILSKNIMNKLLHKMITINH